MEPDKIPFLHRDRALQDQAAPAQFDQPDRDLRQVRKLVEESVRGSPSTISRTRKVGHRRPQIQIATENLPAFAMDQLVVVLQDQVG